MKAIEGFDGVGARRHSTYYVFSDECWSDINVVRFVRLSLGPWSLFPPLATHDSCDLGVKITASLHLFHRTSTKYMCPVRGLVLLALRIHRIGQLNGSSSIRFPATFRCGCDGADSSLVKLQVRKRVNCISK